MSIYDLVDDMVGDAMCCRAFRGRSSTDDITEEDVLEALRRGASMVQGALGARVQGRHQGCDSHAAGVEC